jgi:hypothetical protein
MTLLELALSYAARGWYVFPCWPKTKKPMTANGFEDASNDPEVIRAWWTKTPDANIAIACGKSGIAVLDVDHGLNEDAEAILWMGRATLPATYVVRTGRRPEIGLQFYFSGTMSDVGKFELFGCTGQVKSLGGYVMAAGSIHPDSGIAYAVKNDLPLAPLPFVVAQLRKPKATPTNTVKVAKTAWTLPVGPGENRTGFLMEQTGAMRNLGCGKDAILARMIELNEDPEIISEPVSMDRLESTAENCSKFEVPLQPPEIVLGRPKTVNTEKGEAQVVEELDKSLTDPPLPVYPIEVWEDTLYMDFAKRAREGNYIPLEFFIEGAMTYAGSIAGPYLRGISKAVNARMYTVLIAGPGIGKGSTFGRIRELFPVQRLLRKVDPEKAPRNCSALVNASASENGLNDALLACSRVIQEFEEVDRLLEKTEIQGSGGALMSIIRTCFDDTVPGITTCAGRDVVADIAFLSIMGGTTPSLWRKMMEGRDSYGSGLGGRFNLVASTENRTEGFMPDMDLGDLHAHLEAKFNKLEVESESAGVITTAPDAIELLKEWWRDNATGKPHYNRVNVIAHRKALHLAWMRNAPIITREIMADALKLGAYLVAIRDAYAVVKGEDKSAINENRVLHILRQIKPYALRVTRLVDLLDGQMSRSSITRALDSLTAAGEIEKLTVKGDGRSMSVYRVISL